MQGKKILIGITGSIAAYKTILLVRLLVKNGAEVKVIMTNAAKDFVSPLVLSTLSKNVVLTDLTSNDAWANHVMLGRWADVMIIAPLTCNTLAKMANGLCDNLLMAVYLSATCPILAVPAMDEDMYYHATTKKNIESMLNAGNKVMEVGFGELASGLIGPGRMAEPDEILTFIKQQFFTPKTLSGKKVLVTAGPTYEAIDPVRFIGNHSSGKMGIALANSLYDRGAEVTLILGPINLKPAQGVRTIHVESAIEMYNSSMSLFPIIDIAIMTAAVADYRPASPAMGKIKKLEESVNIALIRNPDILKSCGSIKTQNQFIVGFALETDNEEANAIEKLEKKNADLIVLNSLKDDGAGFKKDTNKVSIFDKNGLVEKYEVLPKETVAKNIVELIIKKLNLGNLPAHTEH